MAEYQKTFEDEVDWKIIDQLHNATNRFSTYSLEIKKIYFVLLGISAPIIFKISEEKFDLALLITPLVTSICFWFLDAFTYYYQEALRFKMDDRFNNLTVRNLGACSNNHSNNNFTINTADRSKRKIVRALFNYSSVFYITIIVIDVVLIICHYVGCF